MFLSFYDCTATTLRITSRPIHHCIRAATHVFPYFKVTSTKSPKPKIPIEINSKSQKGSGSKTAPSHLPLGLNTVKLIGKSALKTTKNCPQLPQIMDKTTSYPNTIVSFNTSSRFIFLLTQDPLIPYDRSNFLFIYHFRNTSTNSVFSIQAETYFGFQTPLRNLVIKAFSFHLSTIFKLLSLFPPLLCQSILPYGKTPCRFAPLGKFWCAYSHTKPYNASSPAPNT